MKSRLKAGCVVGCFHLNLFYVFGFCFFFNSVVSGILSVLLDVSCQCQESKTFLIWTEVWVKKFVIWMYNDDVPHLNEGEEAVKSRGVLSEKTSQCFFVRCSQLVTGMLWYQGT